MSCRFVPWLVAVFALMGVVCAQGDAAQHVATRLGNPATRFATPLKTSADFQNMLRSEPLRADVDFIARESGFRGDMADLRRAAAVANIRPLSIPVGTRLRAMSTRRDGRPVLLREVLWAGKEPIDAYEFYFVSQGRRYRVVSPKACANFWVEDWGPELRPALRLTCDVPDERALRQPIQVCLTLTNTGNDVEPRATLTLPIPDGATLVSATSGGRSEGGAVVWECQNLAPGKRHQVCATFTTAQPGSFVFGSTARGSRAAEAKRGCTTRVVGVPAVLLEVVDVQDPIQIGEAETYEITVLNQGTAVLTDLALICRLDGAQTFDTGQGTTPIAVSGGMIRIEKLPVLRPGETARWQVNMKAAQPGDIRFVTELTADQFPQPITEVEATRQY